VRTGIAAHGFSKLCATGLLFFLSLAENAGDNFEDWQRESLEGSSEWLPARTLLAIASAIEFPQDLKILTTPMVKPFG
jgi:hypothetical protein